MAKKQLIMEKALELFAKQGFEATSVQQITEYCGISKGAFYLAYKSKDELILALLDHFMEQYISNIDYTVKNSDNESLLFSFYHSAFQTVQEHSNFAKLIIKEQAQTFNGELFIKMQYYDQLLEQLILALIERLFGDKATKYDLIYTIRSFMNVYTGLLLFHNIPFDIERLSQALSEKTTVLAEHATIPFITEEVAMFMREYRIEKEVSKEEVLEIMEQKIKELEESVEKESLLLLKEEMINPSYHSAIIAGLLENIRSHPHCKWVAYLLRNYFGYEKN
ncbi:TetR/AcrR family transcriptional regulator [Robertmurraya sp. DFI.2.37]|uniref:TetR/AcrR family transcriptional regulator n=1 Tax=Robertmurraya sp. DFI.2.37 TaxID=3031819 RepID=UPI0012483867|nr:TetR/AcrR family transcriptional regulator [Robertmurraya sp. DFI.2.37]MDF1508652.1 TetR/AcrR family transcriptional regulator [Robertmurraya sp. DFI.2.37]